MSRRKGDNKPSITIIFGYNTNAHCKVASYKVSNLHWLFLSLRLQGRLLLYWWLGALTNRRRNMFLALLPVPNNHYAILHVGWNPNPYLIWIVWMYLSWWGRLIQQVRQRLLHIGWRWVDHCCINWWGMITPAHQ